MKRDFTLGFVLSYGMALSLWFLYFQDTMNEKFHQPWRQVQPPSSHVYPNHLCNPSGTACQHVNLPHQYLLVRAQYKEATPPGCKGLHHTHRKKTI